MKIEEIKKLDMPDANIAVELANGDRVNVTGFWLVHDSEGSAVVLKAAKAGMNRVPKKEAK